MKPGDEKMGTQQQHVGQEAHADIDRLTMPCRESHEDFVRNYILMYHVPYVIVADVTIAILQPYQQ